LRDAALSGSILLLIAGVYAVALTASDIASFIATVGTSASMAVRDFFTLLMTHPQLLLYNENLKNYIQTILTSAAISTSITKQEDGSYLIEFDGQTFLILASMGTLFFAVSEVYKYWDAAKAKIAGAGGVTTQQQLQQIADNANDSISGQGPVVGTKKHSQFKAQVDSLGNPSLKTEQSFLGGREVDYGTPGSVRVDVIEFLPDGTINVYDFKTGGARLTPSRILEIQMAIRPKAPWTVNVIEIR